MKLIWSFLLLLLFAQVAPADTTLVTYRSPETTTDSRYDYDTAVLDLALRKTVAEYGEYRLVPSPVMNFGRAVTFLKANSLANFIIKLSYNESFALVYPLPRFFYANRANRSLLERVEKGLTAAYNDGSLQQL